MKYIFGSYNSGVAQDDPFHPFTPDEWTQQTSTQMRTYLIQHLPGPYEPEPVPSGPISSTRPTGYSTLPIELMGFKQGILMASREAYSLLQSLTNAMRS